MISTNARYQSPRITHFATTAVWIGAITVILLFVPSHYRPREGIKELGDVYITVLAVAFASLWTAAIIGLITLFAGYPLSPHYCAIFAGAGATFTINCAFLTAYPPFFLHLGTAFWIMLLGSVPAAILAGLIWSRRLRGFYSRSKRLALIASICGALMGTLLILLVATAMKDQLPMTPYIASIVFCALGGAAIGAIIGSERKDGPGFPQPVTSSQPEHRDTSNNRCF